MSAGPVSSPILELGGRTVVVHVFPNDPALLRDVRKTALAMHRDVSDELALREAVEAGLRRWYPRLTITCRDELARMSLGEHVWYVMRDGWVHPPQERRDRLYGALATARDVSERAGEAIRDAEAVLERARHPRSTATTATASTATASTASTGTRSTTTSADTGRTGDASGLGGAE